MDKYRFLGAFEGLLLEGFDKEITLEEQEYKLLLKIVSDSELKDILYSGFEKNYTIEYGNDDSCFVMKMQDFIYRMYSLVILNMKNEFDITDYDEAKGLIKQVMDDKFLDLYSAISYDDSDMEIVKEHKEIISEKLSELKLDL